MTPYHDISDEQWQRVAALLTEWHSRKELRGRPSADTRAVLNGVLWVIYSGANWSAMPSRFPAYQTCHRRFKAWYESGALERVLTELFGVDSKDWCEQMALRMRHASEHEGH
ncbi:transposase [Burkholderia singularis]|uniref:transposase n=1 Tax=Burkholderia singularis TaxID=1503053 RepID=UPI000AC51153|nr:transposase [Burkholderia singularis]